MEGEIVNKVAESGIEQIDLKKFMPNLNQLACIDIGEQLWNNLVLKENEFRGWIKTHDWKQYEGKSVTLFCSADAIIPLWAYMLIVVELQKSDVHYGNKAQAIEEIFLREIERFDAKNFHGKIVMIKGCSDIPCPEKALIVLTRKLQPVVKTLMYGEPCSAVPVYKRKSE